MVAELLGRDVCCVPFFYVVFVFCGCRSQVFLGRGLEWVELWGRVVCVSLPVV